MIRIGLVGLGHLGKIHLKLLRTIPEFQLTGIYDTQTELVQQLAGEFDVKAAASLDELIAHADAIDIVTPTISHFEIARQAIKQSKHVFIEKPISQTVEEAKALSELAREARIRTMVGHVERFNPAFTAISNEALNPLFIETHRLAQWNPRGTDVSVILDLMIHDLDILLHIVKSGIRRISASAVAVVSNTPDIANARIEFNNDCVANLTASRISVRNMRKTRIFQKNAYFSIDFLEKKCERCIIQDYNGQAITNPEKQMIIQANEQNRLLEISDLPVAESNAIQTELTLFAKAILNKEEAPINFEAATEVLRVAYQILEKI
jgi:predicted dehydrogenase